MNVEDKNTPHINSSLRHEGCNCSGEVVFWAIKVEDLDKGEGAPVNGKSEQRYRPCPDYRTADGYLTY